MAKKIHKTNAMRLLDKAKVVYQTHELPTDTAIPATEVAEYLGVACGQVFKTLVTTDNHGQYFVFCVQSDANLDLKKAAKVADVKKLEMLKQKDLLPLTGYVHGGCSPVGMKKLFPTVIDQSASQWQNIFVSAGKIGLQLAIAPQDLATLVNAKLADVESGEGVGN